nr:hypothetical protein [Flavobacterium sp.]
MGNLPNKTLVIEIFKKNPKLFLNLIIQFYPLNAKLFENLSNNFIIIEILTRNEHKLNFVIKSGLGFEIHKDFDCEKLNYENLEEGDIVLCVIHKNFPKDIL